MGDTVERRRSSRVHTTVLAERVHDSSSDTSQSDEDVDSSDSEVVKGGRVVSSKRARNKSPAKRAAKRVKRKPTVDASIEVEEDPERVENFLYEAILDDETSIDTLVTDFLESYEEDNTEALKDLVNFVLRCCGTLQEITSYDVEDADTIPETLTQLQDHLTGKDQDVIKVSADTYPLVSKARDFKGFRKQLADFWRIMINHAADKQILFNEEAGKLFNTIEAWLVSMSSSTLRAFRHTATTICLTIMTSLVELSAKLAKELEAANKQLTVESKKSKKGTPKIKTIQKSIDSKKSQNDKLGEFISNYFDAVFVHRYRDVDARIRAESVKELGMWMMKLPSTFFDGQYLRYLGWVLSDTNGPTRLEVIRALTRLYGYDEYAGGLRHFTERFKPRVIEIATEDAETNIRCAALTLVEKIRQRGYFEDDDTETILGCIFDREDRVRHSVGETFQRVLQERESEIIDERLEGEVDDHGDLKAKWVSLKALVGTFYSITKAQDKASADEAAELNIWREQTGLCPGRIRIASSSIIGALNDVDFDTITAYLLYDNDASHEPISAKPADMLKSVLSLTPTEEQYLLELLVAVAEHGESTADGKVGKKNETSTKVSEAVIDALPKLMARFKNTEQISTLLQLLTVCDLSVYSTLRKMKQFETLMNSFSRIFFEYQSELLLRDIGHLLLFLSQVDTLNAAVKDKLLDMQDSLRKDVLDGSIDESDMLLTLKRLEIISAIDDCVLSFDDETGSHSIFEKLKELASSDVLTIKMSVRKCLRNYFMWKVKQIADTKFGLDQEDVSNLISQRDDVLYILDAQVEEGDAEAALTVVDLEKIFITFNEIDSFDNASVRKALDLNLQTLLVKVFQKEVKKYGRLQNRPVALDGEVSSDEDEDESDADEDDKVSVLIDAERKMCTLAGELVATIAAGKLDNHHIDMLLANKGKLGQSYDAILKELPNDMVSSRKAATAKTKAMPKSRKIAQAPDSDVLMAVEDDDIED